MTNAELSRSEREEMFREYQSQHMRRQTKALESIRLVLLAWLWLTIGGVILYILVAVVASSSRF